MMEVLFSDSAAGSLKASPRYKKAQAGTWVTAPVFAPTPAGSLPPAQIEEGEKMPPDQATPAQAQPLEIKWGDIFSFSLALGVGPIAGTGTDEIRRQTLALLYSQYPLDGAALAEETCQQAAAQLTTIHRRLQEGEPLRIWYSRQPDELCGLFWFLAQLGQWASPGQQVFLVEMPSWLEKGNTLLLPTGLGELTPDDWGLLAPLQKPAPAALLASAGPVWQSLQAENAPLRATINGSMCLRSLPETFYDSFLVAELADLPTVFVEAVLIGRVLGRYQLGIGDSWLALRIEKMIEAGQLQPLTTAPADSPRYHRQLQKAAAF